MPARRSKPKPKTKTKAKPATAVTARQLLSRIAKLQEARGLEGRTVIGALCEVIAGHPPTAKRAEATLIALFDEVGIR